MQVWHGQLFIQDHTFLLELKPESRLQTPEQTTGQSSRYIHDLSASPLLLSSEWNDRQISAADHINPVRAGSWDGEMHSRFKAPPSSPQVVSCHNAPGERVRADSHGVLCKANTADRHGPSWWSAPRCSWGDPGPSAGEQTLLQCATEEHEVERANSCEYSCGEVFPMKLYNKQLRERS